MSKEKQNTNLFYEDKTQVYFDRKKTDNKKRFEIYLQKNMECVPRLETFLISTFKQMDETEEQNIFFELYLEKLLQDLSFHIVKYKDFNTAEQPQKIVELLEDVKTFLENVIQNIDTVTKAVQNLQIIQKFYNDLKSDSSDFANSLSLTEETFDIKKSEPVLREDIEKIINYMQKVCKAVQKVRKTQLSFTMEDTELSELIEIQEEKRDGQQKVEQEELQQKSKEAYMLSTKMKEDLNDILMQDFNEDSASLNKKVKQIATVFFDFFSKIDNKVNIFLTLCYIYRDQIFDEIMDDCSVFVSLLLRKITAYKTYVFVKMYKEEISTEISKEIEETKQEIKQIINAEDPEDRYEILEKRNDRIKVMINFVKSRIAQKKTDIQCFNNSYLNKEIPMIKSNLNLNFERHCDINQEELEVLRKIIKDIKPFQEAIKEINTIKFGKSSGQKEEDIHRKLRNFNKIHQRLESKLDAMHTNVDIYKKIRQMTAEQKRTHMDIVAMYLQSVY